MENQQQVRHDDFLRRLYGAFIKNWILMIIIIAVVTVAGVVFSYFRDPNYTAVSKASFSVSDVKNNSYNNNVLTNNFITTMVDFCDEGFVIERANYYYGEYIKSGKHINQFIADVETGVICTDYNQTVRGNYQGTAYITAGNLTVSTDSTDADRIYGFTIKYKDAEANLASDKARIIVLAIAEEVKVPGAEDGTTFYFGFSNVLITPSEKASSTVDLTKRSIVLMFIIAGVVLSVLIVYVKGLFNHSVRDREELEKITGVSLLSYIDDQNAGGR